MHASTPHSGNAAAHNRRKSLRHYLSREMPVEVVYGQRRIAVESGRISDISEQGIGVRAAQPLRLAPGVAVTVAAAFADQVITIPGKVAFTRGGHEIGIAVASDDGHAELSRIAGSVDSVAVGNPDGARTQLSGKISMAARHPIQWAIRAGVSRIDLQRATEIDSSGIGLLLILNERDGLRIENCPSQVCRLVTLAKLDQLCSPDCARRT